ncbi:MAG: caspase family protein [Bacteroidota bacterium]
MKYQFLFLTIFFSFLLLSSSLLAQTIEGKSGRTKIYISKSTGPANLVVENQQFTEPSGNGFLDAEESGKYIFTLRNAGKGDAFNLKIALLPQTDVKNVSIGTPPSISLLAAGGKQQIEIPLSAEEDVAGKQIKLKIEISEANGFDLDPPATFSFSTKQLVPPEFSLDDVGVNDQSGNGQIEKLEIVEITARIKNNGNGDARGVTATINLGDNVFLTGESKGNFSIGNLSAKKSKDISFSVYTNSRATGIPVTIDVSEARSRFNKTLSLDLPFNKQQKKSSEFIAEGKETETVKGETKSSLSIDIERNIPEAKQKNPNAVALIISIAEYQNANIPKVEFAKRDAQFIREYLIKTFGYDAKNILPQNPDELMTVGNMKTLLRNKLPSYLKKDGSSELFIYYTGHGAPSTTTNEAFFVPYDCDPNFVNSDNAYNMNDFYVDIAKLNAKKKFVVIDACFSGQSGSGQTLVKNASPALLKVKNALIADENAVLFQSSSAEQVSNWYPEKKHGMFTYFFLKGLQGSADKNNDGAITANELENFVNDENDGLPYISNREFQRPQKAIVSGKKEEAVIRMK